MANPNSRLKEDSHGGPGGSSRRGAILLLSAMAVVVLIGFAGLAVDVGLLWSIKRRMHTATDAAAIASAMALRNGQDYRGAATDLASFNGFTDNQAGVTVTVNNPPLSGPHTADAEYVEVILAKTQPSYFMRVLGPASVDIRTRAVASGMNAPSCMYTLDPTGSGAINTDGTLTLSCGVLVNSSSATAITSLGNLVAPMVGVVGNYSGRITSPLIRTGVAPAPDPLAYLQPPVVGACTTTNYTQSAGTWALSPGVYCGGITLHGTAKVTLSTGTYILNGGGLTVDGSATLTGPGVTFYNTGTNASYKPIYTQDLDTLNLSAPTTGTLAGILFFQDRKIVSSADNVISGGSAKMEGVLYFPTTPLSFSSQSSVAAAYTIVVAKRISNGVNALTIANDYSSLPKGSPLRTTVLYE